MRLSLIAPLFVAANTLFTSVLSSPIPSKNDNHRVLEEDEVGIFLIKEIEDEQPNDEDEHNISEHTYLEHGSTRKLKRRGRKRRTYNLAHDDGTISEITNGGRDWAKQLVSGRDKIRIPRGSIMSSGKDAPINIMGRYPSRVREKDKKVEHHTHNRQPIYRNKNSIFDRRRNLAYFKGNEELIGVKSLLVVRIILNDGSKYERLQDDLRNDIFAPEGDGQVSLTSQYQACSYNKLKFIPSQYANVNNGVIDIQVDLLKSDGHMAINNAVTAKINSQFNVNRPDKLADYVMYCHPKDTGVGLAYAYVNFYLSAYNDFWCSSLSAGMHELGHNMGLGHAGENDEYDDQVGFMGYSYSAFNTPIMCFNGAKSWQTGWYSDKTTVVNTGECFENDVYGISKYADSTSEVVLVKINDPSATDFYVAFNYKDGINSQTQEASNRVTVTSAAGEGGRTKYAVSTQLVELFIGGQWSSVIGGKNMQVKVLSAHLGKGYARIRISENGADCTTSSPTNRITKAPTPIPTVGPSTAPTKAPSAKPSSDPSTSPTEFPSIAPSSSAPTLIPTSNPNPDPSKTPSSTPTSPPTFNPSQSPSKSLIKEPSSSPSKGVSRVIGAEPTSIPTSQFTSQSPSRAPSEAPNLAPTSVSTSNPSPGPSISPSNGPYKTPTLKPVTENPTQSPALRPVTEQPSSSPNKAPVTEQPTTSPSKAPVSSEPTSSPSEPEVITPEPTDPPLTALPTTGPTQRPVTDSPSSSPVESPSKEPTPKPTISPSFKPSKDPSRAPTPIPTVSPSEVPSNEPSLRPTTQNPTSASPSRSPTGQPTLKPTPSPTQRPVTASTPRPTRKIYSPGVRTRPTRNPTPLPTPQT